VAIAIALKVLLFAAGAAVVVLTGLSAVVTVVVPRGLPVRLTRLVFRLMRPVFERRGRFAKTYEARDHAMALYAPMALMSLPLVWLTLVLAGYTAMFSALGVSPLGEAIRTSGSSLLTLGFARLDGGTTTALAFTEAALGLILLALLITYLPSMYAAFSRREAFVALVAIRAGSPPTAVELLERAARISGLDQLEDTLWIPAITWFIDVEETHTSLGALTFFRSPQPDRSWVTAAGVILDAASLRAAALDMPKAPSAELCVRAGYLALRTVADYFAIPYDPDPDPTDPISLAREEFDEVWERLAAAGAPMRDDQEAAWADFAGWRVNYDTVLIALAALTMAPYAPWSSDRSPTGPYRLTFGRRRRR
jgi:hypothetical protein